MFLNSVRFVERASAGDKLRQAIGINRSQFRANGQNGLGFSRKVEGIARLRDSRSGAFHTDR